MKDQSEIKQRIFSLQEEVDKLEDEAIERDFPEYASLIIASNRTAIYFLKWVLE